MSEWSMKMSLIKKDGRLFLKFEKWIKSKNENDRKRQLWEVI